MKNLIIIGASGHGKVIADIAVQNGYEDIVFLDDNPCIKECAGFPVIGKGCIINTGASVDHDCKVEDFAHISVGAHVAGTCCIGKRTWIGAGAVVSNNVNICGDCLIGAGAVVIRNMEESGTYVGCPARKIR